MAQRTSVKRRVMFQARVLVQAAGFDIVREPFRTRFLPALAQHSITGVLDIGANRGQFGHELRRGHFDGPIVSVEPLAEAFAALTAAATRDPKWQVEQAAVAAEPGTVTVNVSQNSVSSSVLPLLERSIKAAPQTHYVATEEVPATTVDELVQRHGLTPESTLLKIDVQGYESAVLDGARLSLPRFGAVRLEMSLAPLYEGETLMPQMTARLNDAGFDLWTLQPGFVEPGTHRLLQVDGVFFRRG